MTQHLTLSVVRRLEHHLRRFAHVRDAYECPIIAEERNWHETAPFFPMSFVRKKEQSDDFLLSIIYYHLRNNWYTQSRSFTGTHVFIAYVHSFICRIASLSSVSKHFRSNAGSTMHSTCRWLASRWWYQYLLRKRLRTTIASSTLLS